MMGKTESYDFVYKKFDYPELTLISRLSQADTPFNTKTRYPICYISMIRFN